MNSVLGRPERGNAVCMLSDNSGYIIKKVVLQNGLVPSIVCQKGNYWQCLLTDA